MVLSVLALIVALMSTVVAVFGWLAVGTQIQPNYTGSVYSNYFASGKGTESEPFIINRSNHLYNLAWLQNNGEFNKTDESGNLKQQYYFKITADLNMTGYVLPPIGTKDNPFIGNLDGGGYTISNLTVSNVKKDDELMPHEVSRVPKTYNEIGNGYTDIVGFFGVIGHYPGAASCPENVSVSNLYLDNLTVRTRTDNTLIGLFAGYVCGNVSNVGVYRSMVSIGSGVSALSGYTAHSNYALIGDYDKNSTGWAATDTGAGEAGAGFGGSIDMQLLSRRINYMASRMLNTANVTPTTYSYQVNENSAYDANYITKYNSVGTNFNLNAKNYNYNQLAEFYWDLVLSGTGATRNYSTSDLLRCTILPLNVDLTAMGLDSSDETTFGSNETPANFHINSNYLTATSETVSDSNTGYIVGGASSDKASAAYVQLRIQPLNYGFDLSSYGKTIYKSLRYSSSTSGYSNSAGSTAISYTGTNLDLVTSVDGTFYRVTDSKNTTDTTTVILSSLETKASSNFVRYDDVRAQLDTLLKSNKIYGLNFSKALSISNNQLSSDDKITASNIKINSNVYSSYEFASSSINFTLSKFGYMTTVFGGYTSASSSTQSSFSLYKVNRTNVSGENSSSTISSIEEITSVWVNNTNSQDIKYNLTSSSDYTQVYDKSWYNGKVAAGTAYYAEIPLVAGDYCLGGASAYLMYLDIGANGGNGGSSGGETETTYKIEGVRFVYLLNDAYDTLSDFYAFEIVRSSTIDDTDSGVQIYFLMTSSAMCYYVTIDTANTEVKVTDESLSVTTSTDLSEDYGGTKEAPS